MLESETLPMESKMISKKQVLAPSGRNPALELFRCLLMFLIVLGHSWGQGPFSPSVRADNHVEWWEFITIGMLIWHVDGFISISGWFGIKFSWRKFFHLLGTIAFYTATRDIIDYCSGEKELSLGFLSLRSGWFGGSYLVLMMSAPFVNAAVDSLARQSKRALFFSWALVGTAFFFTWAPKHFFTGINAPGFGHQSYAMMLFVYLTARVARKCLQKAIPLTILALAVFAYFMTVVAFGATLNWMGNTANPLFWRIWGLGHDNHAPMVYLAAIVFLLIFAWHVHLPDRVGRVVLFVSPTMFGVYLGHMAILMPLEKRLAGHVSWHPLITMMVSTCIAYVASVAFDMLRRLLCSAFRERVDAGLKTLDDKWARLSGWVGG